MQRFTDKVALITGGSSGIGLAAAKAFSREGAKVVIAARDEMRGQLALQQIQKKGEARFVACDVSQAANVEQLVDETLHQFGRLDYAFNNATNLEVQPGRLHDITEADFDHMVNVAFKGVWLCMKHEITAMLKCGGGAIVNTASIDALLHSPRTNIYAASKSAVIALSKVAAKEYARDGIRINVLCPGAIRTPMLESHAPSRQEVEPLMARYADQIPLGRIGTPEEAAETVLWLCSDSASYITGHNLVIDGGIIGG